MTAPEPLTCAMAEPPRIGGRVCPHTLVVRSGGECRNRREVEEVAEERAREWWDAR